MLGFKSMKTAYATIKGIEVTRMLRKKQDGSYRMRPGILGEKRLIEQAFHLGNSMIADAMELLQEAYVKEPTAFEKWKMAA